MNNKPYPRNYNTEEVQKLSSIVGKATVSGGTDLVQLGYFDGVQGKEAQYAHFLMYYMAWCNGHREYLLEQSKPVAQ
ncbi:MAG: hypothetical protein QNJ60_06065 [Xenococcaceae cyanobacterium MO_188.B19]|nr:hypothetical protein [Xenococcaceae cyanobacterium MO_188.B19]